MCTEKKDYYGHDLCGEKHVSPQRFPLAAVIPGLSVFFWVPIVVIPPPLVPRVRPQGPAYGRGRHEFPQSFAPGGRSGEVQGGAAGFDPVGFHLISRISFPPGYLLRELVRDWADFDLAVQVLLRVFGSPAAETHSSEHPPPSAWASGLGVGGGRIECQFVFRPFRISGGH